MKSIYNIAYNNINSDNIVNSILRNNRIFNTYVFY